MGWQLVALNPTDYAQRPTFTAPKAAPYSGEQIARFLKAIKGDRYEALYLLALFCGLRKGEIFGLERSDFDLARSTVTVNRIVSEVSGKPLVRKRTKTRGSAKTVIMPAIVAQAVRAHLKRSAKDGRIEPLVFCAPEGGLIRQSNFARREYFPALKRSGLPRKRFHLLRKALGTLLAQRGVHPKASQAMLRHANASTTLRYYTDDDGLQQTAVDAIDAAFPVDGHS